jgi:hypothetical protein
MKHHQEEANMSKKIGFPKYSGILGVLLVLILVLVIPITGCFQTPSTMEIDRPHASVP